MHNIKDLRKNLDTYQKKFKERNLNFDIDEFNNKDKINRELINKKELLEQEKKILSKSKEKSNFEKSKKYHHRLIIFQQNKKKVRKI